MNVYVNVLSTISVDNAVKEIDRFISKIKRLEEELPKALAEYGVPVAQMLYDSAAYDIFAHWGTNPDESPVQAPHPDIKVSVESDGSGVSIVARGEKVLFVEFGAGVFYNGEEGYLGKRPEGVVGIGEYGKGYGNRKVWGFTDKETGEHHVTSGTPASNAMYFTTQEVVEHVAEVARRILNND